MHQYYRGFEWLDDAQIEEILPEDAVPKDLHFEDIDETEKVEGLSLSDFEDWLTEGRYDCNVAQLLLYEWTQRYAATDNDCLHDLFTQLLHDFHQEQEETETTTEQARDRLSLAFLAKFIQTRCALNFHVQGTTDAEIRTELAERIGEEIAMVHAYTRLWRGNASYLEPSATLVQGKLEEK